MYKELKPKDFLYGRMGPWPQPSPAHPLGEAPAVLHIPKKEWIDWWLNIGTRYMITLMYTPIAYIKGLISPGLKEVSDTEFLNTLTDSMMSKFITPKLDETDKENFAQYLSERDGEIFIVDLESVKVVKPYKGQYISGTKTLLERKNNKYSLIAIFIDATNTVLNPQDGDAWELAKYYVLQGAALAATLVVHPLLHFPLDSINAITKTALPKNHILFKLLSPHFRFTLPLENAVLTFKSSVVVPRLISFS
jgi:hypothetical protein